MSSASCVECGRTPVEARKMCRNCYSRWRTRQKAYGRWETVFVDAQPVREHVLKLRDAGIGIRHLIDRGVASGTLSRLLYGKKDGQPSRQVRREVANKILSIPIPNTNLDFVRADRVAATGTTRRLQALVANGYNQKQLMQMLGWSHNTRSTGLFHGTRPRVSVQAALEVRELFARLQLVPGTDRRARKRAQQKGWLPPLAWDEDRIDDPTYTPEPLQHRKTVVDDFTDFEELLGLGVHVEDACRRVGVSASTLEARYRRYQRDTPQELLRLVWTQRRERKRGSKQRREAV